MVADVAQLDVSAGAYTAALKVPACYVKSARGLGAASCNAHYVGPVVSQAVEGSRHVHKARQGRGREPPVFALLLPTPKQGKRGVPYGLEGG